MKENIWSEGKYTAFSSLLIEILKQSWMWNIFKTTTLLGYYSSFQAIIMAIKITTKRIKYQRIWYGDICKFTVRIAAIRFLENVNTISKIILESRLSLEEIARHLGSEKWGRRRRQQGLRLLKQAPRRINWIFTWHWWHCLER